MDRIDEGFGIYIHVPFCKSKCPYCDFYSLPDISLGNAYTQAVIREIDTLAFCKPFISKQTEQKTVTSIYFGGGTPSYLGSEQLIQILSAVRAKFTVAPDAEITVEVNPSTPNIEHFFISLAQNGVNRISLGMQSAVDEERKKLGRAANAERVAYCVDACRKAGIHNLSLDIMLGIPLQTEQSLLTTLKFACSLKAAHISVYLLKLEEGTFFYKKKDTLPLPDEDTTADLYLLACSYLKEHGYRHYEISNFCLPNKLAKHNTLYWQDREYLGFGPGAHSYCNQNRFYVPRDIHAFINGAPAVFDTKGGDYEEAFMLLLRLDTGVDLNSFLKRFSVTPTKRFYTLLNSYSRHELIYYNQNTVSLTDRGMLLSNSIISSLLNELT